MSRWMTKIKDYYQMEEKVEILEEKKSFNNIVR